MNAAEETKWQVPEPFILNCRKHHLGFLKYWVDRSIDPKNESFLDLKKNLLLIGESQMDLYTGTLYPAEIADQIYTTLLTQNVHQKRDFENWIESPPCGYKNFVIADNSSWTIRKGKEKHRYIHIHPSRYSLHSIRIKANTLKTLIAIKFLITVENRNLTLELLNEARLSFFNAPPVKSMTAIKGIEKTMNLLFPK